MNQKNKESDTPTDQEIIKLAYSMAIGIHRFQEMFDLLKDQFAIITDNNNISHIDETLIPSLRALEPHFENAQSLMTAQGREMDTATHSMKVIDADSRPSALIHPNGRVFYANKPAVEFFGFQNEQYLDEKLFERDHHKNLMQNLCRLEEFEVNKIISIFGMNNVQSDEVIKIALTKAYTADGSVLAHISAINISWLASTGKHFQSLFDLTPVELEITKAIVTGISLKMLAKTRQRSLGTVRNQTKMLLTKLNLRSQTELACLYSGFSKFNNGLISKPFKPKNTGYAAEQKMLLRDENRISDYRIAGPANGKPVIFIPALLGGMAITQKLHEALCSHNIKLLMIWRPGLGESGLHANPKPESFEHHARDIAAMLDELSIEKAPIIGCITGAPFAVAMGKYLHERITHIININGIVPTASGPHIEMLDKVERTRTFLLRSAPKVGRMVIHAAMRLVDSGYDQEFMQVHLQDSPLDLETTEEDEIKYLFRADFRQMTKHGYEGLANDLVLSAMDWSFLFEKLSMPVHNLVSEENVHFTPKVIHSFATIQSNYHVNIINDAAHLALYQQPNAIFGRINDIICEV